MALEEVSEASAQIIPKPRRELPPQRVKIPSDGPSDHGNVRIIEQLTHEYFDLGLDTVSGPAPNDSRAVDEDRGVAARERAFEEGATRCEASAANEPCSCLQA